MRYHQHTKMCIMEVLGWEKREMDRNNTWWSNCWKLYKFDGKHAYIHPRSLVNFKQEKLKEFHTETHYSWSLNNAEVRDSDPPPTPTSTAENSHKTLQSSLRIHGSVSSDLTNCRSFSAVVHIYWKTSMYERFCIVQDSCCSGVKWIVKLLKTKDRKSWKQQ